jgi:hypothetical protein
MTTHTPGPWRWARTTINTGTGAYAGDLQLVTEHRPVACNDPVVLTVRDDWTRHLLTHPEGQANIQLIAEAPVMRAELESLRQAVRALQSHAIEHGWQDVDEPIAALLAWPVK